MEMTGFGGVMRVSARLPLNENAVERSQGPWTDFAGTAPYGESDNELERDLDTEESSDEKLVTLPFPSVAKFSRL